MEKYKILYKKGEYRIICLDTDNGFIKFLLRTNSIDSLDLMVSRMSKIDFELTNTIPKDIREMLSKYANVKNF